MLDANVRNLKAFRPNAVWINKTAYNKISRRKQFKEEGLNYLEELAK